MTARLPTPQEREDEEQVMGNEAMTPRPWPEGTIPTNEQMADWLEVCTRWERVAFVQNARHNSDQAGRCFTERHDALLQEVHALRQRVGTAYDEGWNAAAAAALEAVDSAAAVPTSQPNPSRDEET